MSNQEFKDLVRKKEREDFKKKLKTNYFLKNSYFLKNRKVKKVKDALFVIAVAAITVALVWEILNRGKY